MSDSASKPGSKGPPSPSPQLPGLHPAGKMWGAILSGAIFLWGSYIAVGAFLADDQRRLGKPLVIFGCTLFFVVLWNIVWWAARKRGS